MAICGSDGHSVTRLKSEQGRSALSLKAQHRTDSPISQVHPCWRPSLPIEANRLEASESSYCPEHAVKVDGLPLYDGRGHCLPHRLIEGIQLTLKGFGRARNYIGIRLESANAR